MLLVEMVVDVVVETVELVVDAVVLILLIVTVLEKAVLYVRLVTVRLMERVALLVKLDGVMMLGTTLSLVVETRVLLRVVVGVMKEAVMALMLLMI